MNKVYCIVFLVTFSFAQEEINLTEGFTINVEPERPRVQMISTREKPEFPEVKINKVFFEEIIDKYKNYKYSIEGRKLIAKIRVAEELSKLK